MPKLYVTIYKGLARDVVNTPIPAPETPSLAEWSLEVGFESKQSDPFPMNAKFISVTAGVDCCLAFGKDPVAKTEFHPISEGETRWYGVYPGQRLAVIVGPAT